MEVRLCSCWTSLWTVVLLLKGVSSDPSSQTRFTPIRTSASFNEAMRTCSPGVLPSTATEQEVQQILEVLRRSKPDQYELTVWIGLRKPAKDCTDPSLPLRGFRWEDSGSHESKVHTWMEEPKLTCTEARCAALKIQSVRSAPRLGLVPVSCRTHFQYFCKMEQGVVLDGPGTTTRPAATSPKLDQTRPAAFRPDPTEPGQDAEPSHGYGASPGSELSPEPSPDSKPSPSSEPRPGSELSPGLELSPGSDPSPDSEPSPEPSPGSELRPGSGACQYSSVSSIRAFSLDPRNSSRMQVECWSDTKLDLFCSGEVWLTEGGAPVDLSRICQKCPAGFQKDPSGRCVDVDECSSGEPCRHTCVNTAGSFSCVCADPSDQDPSCSAPVLQEERQDQGSLLAILVPVLAALAGLLVLVVVLAVTIRCCMKKRRKEKETDRKETP
ncbi:C-type lectin domain family 14 member A [Austrofundulus limnaeus]|uniref:Complement component C1q receptor-like n=1 Tax=Austrofundulus limnaeus TaxID=52670 RepID=A0A2I4CC71_AUSLI|nr:PREDICTED: complement component C1q receptor-like [Austrofundulus limnaeus]XP_013877586.1 PREDICTED: complement component C1q receptor-like [Austrofundulus limnaeus]